ncbi:MAG TPA: tetratricopeptide repeat protein, partial [Chryseosolibacter sp.]
MKHTGFLVIVLVLLAGCSAEKKATKAFRLGKYQTTIDIFKQALAKNPDDGRANYFVAESYRLSNRLKEAAPFYAKAGGRGID